jgi:uncharacterized protein with HEPN domain
MQLIAIRESLKNIDKITNKTLLEKYPQVDWKSVQGIRDIISHHYFVCDTKLDTLIKTIEKYLKI